VLAALESSWHSLRTELVAVQARVEEGARRREADLRSLEACDDAMHRLEDARHQAVARVFVMHAPPIWQIREAWGQTDDGRARLSEELSTRLDSLRVYLQAHARGSVLTLALAVACTLLLFRGRARIAHNTDGGVAPASVAQVLRAPMATAILVTLFFTRPLRPDPPLALLQLFLPILFWAAVVVLRSLIDPVHVPALYALGILLVVDLVRGVLFAMPAVEQIVLIVEMAAAAALFFRTTARLGSSTGALTQFSPWLRATSRILFRGLTLATSAALAAAALGYVELADLVGGGGVTIACMTIVLFAMRIVVGDLLGLALGRAPLVRLRMVRRHGVRAERAIGRMLDVALAAYWLFSVLQLLELWEPARAALRGLLDARLQVGELDVALSRVLAFPAVVIVAWLTARVVVFALEEDVYPRLALPRGVPYATSTLVRYGLLLTGFLLALGTLGLDLTRITVLVSAFGLGLGFGMQQIINNFVSGLILLFERPVQVGDSVQLGDLSGQMLRIGIRSSTIRTGDGAEVIVPNFQAHRGAGDQLDALGPAAPGRPRRAHPLRQRRRTRACPAARGRRARSAGHARAGAGVPLHGVRGKGPPVPAPRVDGGSALGTPAQRSGCHDPGGDARGADRSCRRSAGPVTARVNDLPGCAAPPGSAYGRNELRAGDPLLPREQRRPVEEGGGDDEAIRGIPVEVGRKRRRCRSHGGRDGATPNERWRRRALEPIPQRYAHRKSPEGHQCGDLPQADVREQRRLLRTDAGEDSLLRR
jgi:hypothetical protein